jgi:hypothetical protein
MTDITSLSDETLIEETHRLARAVSYYNAAEGNWSQEAEARNATKKEFWDAQDEMEKRGLVFENKGYLI